MNKNISISCVIIGFNSKNNLINLLSSINRADCPSNMRDKIEIIYIDDGSQDFSKEAFNKFILNYQKKCFSFSTNRGRVFARQRGVDCSSGKWVLFLNSTVLVDQKIFSEYIKILNDRSAVAFMGSIQYKSSDLIFENYLNNKKRGVNKYCNQQVINYRYLLFGNCLIKSSILKRFPFNTNLKYYGGEELDFASRLNYNLPNKISAHKSARVYRVSHPSFVEHCNRMAEYGEKNFPLLNKTLQKTVIKYPLFLNSCFVFKLLINCSLCFSLNFYARFKNKQLQFLIIKLGLWSAVLKGFYKA